MSVQLLISGNDTATAADKIDACKISVTLTIGLLTGVPRGMPLFASIKPHRIELQK